MRYALSFNIYVPSFLLLCAQVFCHTNTYIDTYPYEDLAMFGHMTNKKLKGFKNHATF
jgi:hypothetical protein